MDERFAFLDSWNGLSEQDRACYMMSMSGDEPYTLQRDSFPQGNPVGDITAFHMDDCRTYPGVGRDYWIYVPKQYHASRAACLMIFLDGRAYIDTCNVTTLMDNKIARGEMPVTIGLFVGPGDIGPGYPIYGGTDNRSEEYDSIDDRFARFLIEDMIPLIKSSYSITDNPEGRCIVGMSSAGNAAFVAAYHRPDAFRKVISNSGSFTNLRGGHLMPTKIRTEEKRPLRVVLTTGEKDLDTVFGSRCKANEYMASSLAYKGYDYQFFKGVGGHTYMYTGELFPQIISWMWRDYEPG